MKPIPIEKWGKDHWSTFAYAETVAVDCGGLIVPAPLRMRTNHERHPFKGNPMDGNKYPTILKDMTVVQGHDDWDCLYDAVEAGLLEEIANDHFKLTDKGRAVAYFLRQHKSRGGTFKNFDPQKVVV